MHTNTHAINLRPCICIYKHTKHTHIYRDLWSELGIYACSTKVPHESEMKSSISTHTHIRALVHTSNRLISLLDLSVCKNPSHHLYAYLQLWAGILRWDWNFALWYVMMMYSCLYITFLFSFSFQTNLKFVVFFSFLFGAPRSTAKNKQMKNKFEIIYTFDFQFDQTVNTHTNVHAYTHTRTHTTKYAQCRLPKINLLSNW